MIEAELNIGPEDINTPKGLITIEQFREVVEQTAVPNDIVVKEGWRFELTGEGENLRIKFHDMHAGALAMYQAKSLSSQSGIDITGTTKHLNRARVGDEKSLMVIKRQLTQLNAAWESAFHLNDNNIVARTFVDGANRVCLGGLVTRRYAPLTHRDLVDKMLENTGFAGAMVHRSKVNEGRLEATLLLNGTQWEVDGGLKSGIKLRNGQFGDCSYGFLAMLFRLLCTNGMMDVQSMERMVKRHVGDQLDLAADVAEALTRADEMFGRSKASMEIEIDVRGTLVELHRRGFINRGAIRKASERINETFSGVGVNGSDTTVWGLSQTLTAAGRDYSFSQMDSLGKLAGRLVFEDVDNVVSSRPVPNGAPSIEEVFEEFFAQAA